MVKSGASPLQDFLNAACVIVVHPVFWGTPCVIFTLQDRIGKAIGLFLWKMVSRATRKATEDPDTCTHRPGHIIFNFLSSFSLMKRPSLVIFCLLKFIIHRAAVMDDGETTQNSLAAYFQSENWLFVAADGSFRKRDLKLNAEHAQPRHG